MYFFQTCMNWEIKLKQKSLIKSLSRKNTFSSVSLKRIYKNRENVLWIIPLICMAVKYTPSWWLWSSVSSISLWLIVFETQKKYLWNAILSIYEIRIYDNVFGLNLIEWCFLYVRGCLNYEINLIKLDFIVIDKSGYQLNLMKGEKMMYSLKIIRCTYLVAQSHYDKKKSINKNIIL